MGALNIVLGLVSVLLATAVLAYPGLDTLTLVLMLASALLVIGLARIIFGIFVEYVPDWLRALNISAGFFGIVVTIINMLFPQYITQTLIYLLSVALLASGITSALVGRLAEPLPNLLRGLFMIFGISSIALSVVAFMSTPLGFSTSLYALSTGYLVSGISEIFLGVTWIRLSQSEKVLDKAEHMVQKEP